MGRTVSNAPGYAPDEQFDPRLDDFVSKDRKYLHFDLPLTEEERTNFRLTSREMLSNSFWPLIGYTAEERRVRKDEQGKIVFKLKERPIKFGSHRDAALYEYYGNSLARDYENFLGGAGFSASILAYRNGIGNNIDHSKSLFDEIRLRKSCTAIGMDISGFFDNIRHDVLYGQICRVRRKSRLDDVDFMIFKRMTRFEWVESDDLKARLGNLYGRSGRICYPRDFRTRVRERKPSKIQINTAPFGIPQGTPLSGLYANISLLEFDASMVDFVQALGGSYRRYSDDLAFVVPERVDSGEFVAAVGEKLTKIGLAVSPSKTEISNFQIDGNGTSADRPFQYLGFTFDGRRTLIRQSSLNRYYAKMSRGIRAKVRAAKRKGVGAEEIYLRQLFKRYTHFGRNRNFPRYAYRAAEVHGSPEIRLQLRRHKNVFDKMVKDTIDQIY